MAELILEGDYVVLMRNFDSENMKIIPVIKDTIIHYGKLHFDPSPLIGSEFGSVYAIRDKQMVKVDNFEEFDQELSTTVTSNMMITFNDKSEFSKEKIIKKRKRKSHFYVVTAMKPNLLLINELLYARDKIGGLRCDSLSQILTLSNIQDGTKCLLLDHNLGLLTGAVMSRILPSGICIQLFADIEASYTTRKNLEMLNIKEDKSKNKIFAITFKDAYKVYVNKDSFELDNEALRIRDQERLVKLNLKSENDLIKDRETSDKMNIDSVGSVKEELIHILNKKVNNREVRNTERIKAAAYLKSKSIDSLIMVVQNDHPLPILKFIFTFLSLSRQFVIYSDTVEPLIECYQFLKTNQLAISLNISETWLRRFQVLPDRTRPEMNMSGYGGYILSGTKASFCGQEVNE